MAQRISTEELRSVGEPVTLRTGDQAQARFQEALLSTVRKLLQGARRARADKQHDFENNSCDRAGSHWESPRNLQIFQSDDWEEDQTKAILAISDA